MASPWLLLLFIASYAHGRAPSQRAKWKDPGAGGGGNSRSVRQAVSKKAAAGVVATHVVPFKLPGSPPVEVSVTEVCDRAWWDRQSETAGSNPFGAKLWPGSLAVAEYLARLPAEEVGALRVLELGCGNGLCSLTAASRGATVIASDVSKVALNLMSTAAESQGLDIEALTFDLGSSAALPDAELIVVGDLLYDASLAVLVANRVAEATNRGTWVVVGTHKLAGRETFLKRLSALTTRGNGAAGERPALAEFTVQGAVKSPALKWKEKRTVVLHLNTPEWAVPAIDGSRSVEI